MANFQHSSHFDDSSPEALFAWHEASQAFKRLTPPWEPVRLLKAPEALNHNHEAVIQIPLLGRLGRYLPLRAHWHARHHGYFPPHQFIDSQVAGPFAAWRHLHQCLPVEGEAKAAQLLDDIEYALPFAPVSQWLAGPFVEAKLARMFRYRHRITALDLKRKRSIHKPLGRVLITGASGFVGQHLVAFLLGMGIPVRVLLRRMPHPRERLRFHGAEIYTCREGQIPAEAFEGVESVITLNGEGIVQRWSPAAKARLTRSRVDWNAELARVALTCKRPPRRWLAASGISAYAHHNNLCEAPHTEQSPADTSTFLGQLAADWEASLNPLREVGCHVSHLRFGVIMQESGGYMAAQSLAQQWFGGIGFGEPNAPLPWVSLEDVLGAMLFLLQAESPQPLYNLCTANPCHQRDFLNRWAKANGVPFWGFLPAKLLYPVLGGEMVKATFESGVHAVPKALLDAGYTFAHPDLNSLFSHHVDIQNAREWLVSRL